MSSGSEVRQASKMVRISAKTHELLSAEAARLNLPLSQTIDRLVPRVGHRSIYDGMCRNCGVETRNPRARHRNHLADCVLYDATRVPKEEEG